MRRRRRRRQEQNIARRHRIFFQNTESAVKSPRSGESQQLKTGNIDKTSPANRFGADCRRLNPCQRCYGFADRYLMHNPLNFEQAVRRGSTMSFHLLVILGTLSAAPPSLDEIRLARWGHDPSRGVLVNHTPGIWPHSPVDPGRPTIVVVHGMNPFSRFLHFTMAERYAEAVGGVQGGSVNVLAWDWNAATLKSIWRAGPNDRLAIEQGYALAEALWRSGVDPARLHLVGHSSGGLVAATAARTLTNHRGAPIARLTVLDPAKAQHRLIFGTFGAGSAASRVEHYWANGPSGFGREAAYPGVNNGRVNGPRRARGLFRPLHTDHLHVARWHIASGTWQTSP